MTKHKPNPNRSCPIEAQCHPDEVAHIAAMTAEELMDGTQYRCGSPEKVLLMARRHEVFGSQSNSLLWSAADTLDRIPIQPHARIRR